MRLCKFAQLDAYISLSSTITSPRLPAATMSYVSDQPSALIVPLLLVFAPIPVIVATRPPKVIRALVLGAQCQIVYSTMQRNRFPMGDPYHDYVGADTLSMLLLTSIHWYFLADPLHDGTQREGETQPAREMPLPKRLWWATYLVGCVRGVGWNKPVSSLADPLLRIEC